MATQGSRDYAAEMRAIIDAETAGAPYVPALVAERIVTKLRATDPDLLTGWLDLGAEQFVREAITGRDRSIRGSARRSSSAREFAKAADQAGTTGDVTPLRRFLDCPYPVAADGKRKRLADLGHDDLRFVAGTYGDDARAAKFEAVFFRALARKVRRGTVADHFTEQQLADLRRNLAA